MEKYTIHARICEDLNALYTRKNHDYGDSFGKGFAEYGMAMPCIRLEDKLNRLKTLTKQEAQVNDESIDDTLMDLANYAIMTLVERQGAASQPKTITVVADDYRLRKGCATCHYEACAEHEEPCNHCLRCIGPGGEECWEAKE